MYAVWRQDDNGHKYIVKTCRTEAEAKAEVETYERLGHKQIYWLQPVGPDDRGAKT